LPPKSMTITTVLALHPSSSILAATGFSGTDALHGVSFDIKGDGNPLKLAWTVASSKNGWLVLDRNGNGKVDNGQEMFGNYTPQPQCSDPNGFLALKEYDKLENSGNGDGVIDSRDAVYNGLRIWIDANHNGMSEPSELFKLPDVGLSSLSLDFKASGKRDRYGNRYRFWAKVNGNADVGKYAWDVYLTTLPPPPTAAQLELHKAKTIDGAKNPELIPTEIAQEIFLRMASCSEDDPDLYKRKCRLVHRAVGFSPVDSQIIPQHLAGFRDQVSDLDNSIGDLRRETAVDKVNQRNTLNSQRQNAIKNKFATLRQKLSPDGKAKLDAYIEHMKSKIKFVPSES